MRICLKSDNRNKVAIDASIAKVEALTEGIVMKAFNKLGQEALAYAVTHRDWKDYTGNLQDSLGYGIFKNGSLIFWESLDKKQYDWALGHQLPNHDRVPYGANAALQVVSSRMDMFSTGYKLLVVAGMRYALNVENINLHEVLTQAMFFTESNWKGYFKSV